MARVNPAPLLLVQKSLGSGFRDMRVPGMLSLKLGDLGNQAWADFKKKNKHVSKGDAEYETAAERAQDSKPQ